MVRLAEPFHAGEDDRDTLRKALDLPLPVALCIWTFLMYVCTHWGSTAQQLARRYIRA